MNFNGFMAELSGVDDFFFGSESNNIINISHIILDEEKDCERNHLLKFQDPPSDDISRL